MRSKTVWLVVGLVIAVLGVGVYLAYHYGLISPSADIATGSKMSLSPPTGSYEVEKTFNVTINVDTANRPVASVTAIIDYDAAKLEVVDADTDTTNGVNIKTGNIFASGIKTNKIVNGQIVVEALSSGGESTNFTGAGILGTINFRAKALGTAKVEFDFTKGATSDTMLAYAGENILDTVANATYTITAATPTDGAVTLTATPTTIASGGSAILNWTNATAACTALPLTTPAWFDSSKATGAATVKPDKTTTYKLTCGNVVKEATVTVSAAPVTGTVTLTADDTDIDEGDSVNLTWTIVGLTPSTCTDTPDGWFPATAGLTGTAKVTPTEDTTYKLTCGTVSGQVVVNILSAGDTCATPLTETRTQTCPAGQTGSITQTRTKGAAPTCAWGDWTTTTTTCKVGTATTPTTTTTATTRTASTGPETPLVAGGLLSLVFGAYYFIKRRLG